MSDEMSDKMRDNITFVVVGLLSVFMFLFMLSIPMRAVSKVYDSKEEIRSSFEEYGVYGIIKHNRGNRKMEYFVELKNDDILYVALKKEPFSFSDIEIKWSEGLISFYRYKITEKRNIEESKLLTDYYEKLKERER